MTRPTDGQLAEQLAEETGRLLLDLLGSELEGRALASEADRIAQEYLAGELTRHRPDDAILSEEATDGSDRLSAHRVWIIDPLDGTREYSEHRHDWAIHVALWQDGELTAGAVAIPQRGVLLSTEHPSEVPARSVGPLRIAVSRTRPPQQAQQVATELDADLVPMGSAGYKAGAVLLGEVDAYLHAGGQYEWDSAAPVVVARAAGLHATRVDGSPLTYNQPEAYLPDLLVARPEAADSILGITSRAG